MYFSWYTYLLLTGVFWCGISKDLLIQAIMEDKQRDRFEKRIELAFIRDQMSDRKMTIGSRDLSFKESKT